MFAEELKVACGTRDRIVLRDLLESIPLTEWRFGPYHAFACYGGTTIAVHWVSGGSGINTYGTVRVYVEWPDHQKQAIDNFSADELRLPNYIPKSEQR